MGVKFGSDGTLYCNTVKYNYKQARNLIADNSYGNISGTQVWGMSNVSVVASPAGYKSYRCFQFNTNTTAMLTQSMPAPIANHKYYGGLMWKTTGSSFSGGDTRFEWFLRDQDNNTDLVFATKNVATNGNWVKLSSVVQAGSNPASGSWQIRNFLTSASTACYCSRMIIIDLTDTFGSGNEPTKEWCDNNIREWEVIQNYGCISTNVPYSNLNIYSGSQLSTKANFNYLQFDDRVYPREYFYGLIGSSSYSEGFLNCSSNATLTPSSTYYFQSEVRKTNVIPNQSLDYYFPVSGTPLMNHNPIVDATQFNGGGGMASWKRYSSYGTRTAFSSGSYPQRFDYNNRNESTTDMFVTALQLNNVQDNINVYNSYNGTNISLVDTNKEWCDRWIDGRSSPIIHIKDPKNTSIKFNPNKYEVLEYIESTGTQYIDTGIASANDVGIECTFYKNNTADTVVMGSRGSSSSNTRVYINPSNNYFNMSWNGINNTISGTSSYLGKVVTASLNLYNSRERVVDGTRYSNITETLGANTNNIIICAASYTGGVNLQSSCRIYGAKVTKGSSLVRDFIPAKDNTTGEAGLYDLVDKKFYTNAGTGAFTAEAAITNTNDRYISETSSDYNIICNDIEIRPEMNKITMDSTGTIKCKKLVRTQAY